MLITENVNHELLDRTSELDHGLLLAKPETLP